MNQEKKLYETTVIINASLEDPQIESVINRIQEILTRYGGEVKTINKLGRKRLAYPIQKKNIGFYVNIEFEASGSIMSLLERAFSLEENIIRYLNIRITKKMQKAREQKPSTTIFQEQAVISPEIGELDQEALFEEDIDEPEL